MGDRAGLPCLTLRQPWASLVVLGVKTIETRSWRAPEALIGRYIGIHAAARRPAHMTKVGRFGVDRKGDGTTVMYDEVECIRSGVDQHVDLPLGVLLGTARLVACVPMDDDPDRNDRYLMITRMPELILYEAGWWDIPPDEDADASTDVTDQLPYGDFTPGRWAWLLEDPAPTTERCPRCLNQFEGRMPGHVYGSNWDWVPCQTCMGAGRCDPIPARGRPGTWYWAPERSPEPGSAARTGPRGGGRRSERKETRATRE